MTEDLEVYLGEKNEVSLLLLCVRYSTPRSFDDVEEFQSYCRSRGAADSGNRV